jgi:hypothetical protein
MRRERLGFLAHVRRRKQFQIRRIPFLRPSYVPEKVCVSHKGVNQKLHSHKQKTWINANKPAKGR